MGCHCRIYHREVDTLMALESIAKVFENVHFFTDGYSIGDSGGYGISGVAILIIMLVCIMIAINPQNHVWVFTSASFLTLMICTGEMWAFGMVPLALVLFIITGLEWFAYGKTDLV